jgi:branched-chain amino acid transport system substrate-binding protein
MRSLKWFRLVALVLLAAVATAPAYAQGGAVATIAKGKTIKIGWAGDQSLQLIKPSTGVLNGAKIAVDQMNGAGGIQGFMLEIVALDDQCTGDQATTVAQKFASDPEVVAVVGHVCSGATIPASDVYEKARIVLVSGSATANAVTNRGLTVVNRVAFNDDNQGKADALYIFNELDAKTMAVLDDGQSYGKGLADTVNREFVALGGEVTAAESIDFNSKDFRPVLTKLLSEPPDVLYFGGYEGPAALITTQMREVGLADTLFFSDDGAFTSTYLQLSGKDAEGQYASSVATKADEESMKEFKAAFEKTFSVQYADYDPYQPHGYDASAIIITAIAKVAVLDADGNLVIDREALIKEVRSTKDFKGLTGTLTCDSKGECGAGEIGIHQVKDGAWTNVKVYSGADLSGTPEEGADATEEAPAEATMAATEAK